MVMLRAMNGITSRTRLYFEEEIMVQWEEQGQKPKAIPPLSSRYCLLRGGPANCQHGLPADGLDVFYRESSTSTRCCRRLVGSFG